MRHILHNVSYVAHLVGLVIGLGGATLTDALFVTCVRKRRTGHTMLVVIRRASELVLAGYALLLLSGFGLLLTGSHTSSRFWAKMIVVAVIGANGLAAHFVTFPKIHRKVTVGHTVNIDFLHQLSIVAAVSVASWYSALVMGAWRSNAWPFIGWLAAYLVLLFAAVSVSMVVSPHVLNATKPGFEDVFPTLHAPAQRAASMMPPRRRPLPPPSDSSL